ncbi:MAG: hypothetical protein WCS65_03310 [Verrucomicrobiae bacterium]
MEKKTATISIPDEEWIFKGNIPNPELCFVWECLRCIKKPKSEEIGDVLIGIASTGIAQDSMGNTVIPDSTQGGSEKIVAADSSARWFQQFIRRYKFKPLVLLAWVAWRKEWPTRPWVEESSRILPDLEKFEALPALLDINQLEFWEARYREPIHVHADFLMLRLIYGTRSPVKKWNPKKPAISAGPNFELLLSCGLLCQPDFCLNWQNYTRQELVAKFDIWLQNHWPPGLKPLQAGGRVDPVAWLQGLGAYRLYMAAKTDTGKLRGWKKEFTTKYRQSEHSIAWHAFDFFDSVLAQFIPKEFLPERPVTQEK